VPERGRGDAYEVRITEIRTTTRITERGDWNKGDREKLSSYEAKQL
jgi:hypothetical protein